MKANRHLPSSFVVIERFYTASPSDLCACHYRHTVSSECSLRIFTLANCWFWSSLWRFIRHLLSLQLQLFHRLPVEHAMVSCDRKCISQVYMGMWNYSQKLLVPLKYVNSRYFLLTSFPDAFVYAVAISLFILFHCLFHILFTLKLTVAPWYGRWKRFATISHE